MGWKEEYKRKLITADDAASLIKSGDRVYAGTASSIAYGILNALWKRKDEIEHVTILSSNGYEPCSVYDEIDGNPFEFSTYFLGSNERPHYRAGHSVEYSSVHLSQVTIWAQQTAQPDYCLFEVSKPDENGYFSYGPSGVAISDDIKVAAKKIILQVNKHVPYVLGESNLIHISEVDNIVECDMEYLDYPKSTAPDEEAMKISQFILEEIPDGATFQLGLGNISTAIGYGLKHKNDLGIHTELLNQPMYELMKNGNVTNKCKGYMDGKTVYSFTYGDRDLYNALDRNDVFYCMPFRVANDPRVIAKNKNMISINSTMSFNLYGEAASDCLGWRQQSATGGQLDFVRGAQWSEGGKSFLCCTSSFMKNGKRMSRIVPTFAPGSAVTTPRSDVQYIATEYGCINLKPLTMSDRARAVISLAHPDFRDELTEEAKKYGLIR